MCFPYTSQLYWKKRLCACHSQVLTENVVVYLVLGFVFSTHVGIIDGRQTIGAQAGGRRASGRWAGGRVIEAAGNGRKHSKMSSWEPMRGERGGEGAYSFRKSPREPVGGCVRAVP